MSKEDRLIMILTIILTFGLGLFIVPVLQQKCTNKLYKSYNRKVLRDKYGITIDKK